MKGAAMGNTATLGRWGNSPAVRIPLPFSEQLGLKIGDTVDMTLCDNHIEIAKPTAERFTLQARIQGWDGKRYETTEYDWGKPAGNEVW
jgi:antitoxin MazE